MKRTDEEWNAFFEKYDHEYGFSIAEAARFIQKETLETAAKEVERTSTLPTFEWLANKIRTLL
jgi:hypothetical protein